MKIEKVLQNIMLAVYSVSRLKAVLRFAGYTEVKDENRNLLPIPKLPSIILCITG